ncbi:Deleted in malignant brain tumors 1 protein, partial [Geodia barretti]
MVGRLEVCANGTWGTVCGNAATIALVRVACRQLNHAPGASYALLSFGAGQSSTIHLDDVHCIGSEERITECSHSRIGIHNCRAGTEEAGVICTILIAQGDSVCSHSGIGIHNCRLGIEKAGVICTNTTCEDGTVHLVGGDDVSRGRVEYCYQGAWYSVCASDWDESGLEAHVICRSLGHQF